MAKNNYIQKFNLSKKYIPSDKELQTLKTDINRFIPIVNYFVYKKHKDNPEDLKISVANFIHSVFGQISESRYIDSYLYESFAMDDIFKNSNIIDKEYPNIKDMPDTHSVYTAQQNRSRKLVLVHALHEVNDLLDFATKNHITANTNLDRIVIQAENPEDIMALIKMSKNILKEKTIKDKILHMLKIQKQKGEEFIQENQITSLKSLYDFFEALGFTKSYMSAYNNSKDYLGFSELDYPLYKEQDSSNSISLAETFSEDFLKTLPLRDLCFLNAFWCNRFAKECSRLNSAFCAINSLDLWQDIIDGQDKFSVSDEVLTGVLKKSNFLSGLIRDSFMINQENIYSAELKEGINSSATMTTSYNDYYTKIHNTIKNDYKHFFDNIGLESNDFYLDAAFAAPFVNLEMFAYQKKNTTLEPLIKNMLDHNHCKNWGIIRNETLNGETLDSIDSQKPIILLAFDIEGFNMPFRFHVPKDDIMDLAVLSNGNYLIPEYQGADDFIINNEIVRSNIIMPIPKHHKKIIMDNANSDGPNKNFWEHLYFLVNGKFPKHLTETVQKSKKQVVSTRLPICYTDLKTGKRFVKNKNQFIEVDDSNVR